MRVTVCKGGGGVGGRSWGVGELGGRGVSVRGKMGAGGGVQLPDSLVDEAVLQVCWSSPGDSAGLLPDGSRLKKLCVGWVVSPAMLRALRVRRVL